LPLCLLTYDILLTLDVEVKYFWKDRSGSFSRWIFFLNRYWPAVNLIFHNTVLTLRHPPINLCTFWFQYVAYSTGAEHMMVGAILILRLYAMFNCNKRLLAILLCLYAILLTTETVLIGVVTHEFRSQEALRAFFPGCAPTNIPLWSWWYWVPSMTFESICLLLALWKTMETHRNEYKSSNILIILLRDSILYFGGVTLITIANFAAWYIAPLPLYGMFIGCHIGIQSILGCRMLLNIRESASTSYWSGSESETLVFKAQSVV